MRGAIHCLHTVLLTADCHCRVDMCRMLFTYHCSVFSFTLTLLVVTHTWGVRTFSVVVVGFCIGYSKTSLLGCSKNVFI